MKYSIGGARKNKSHTRTASKKKRNSRKSSKRSSSVKRRRVVKHRNMKGGAQPTVLTIQRETDAKASSTQPKMYPIVLNGYDEIKEFIKKMNMSSSAVRWWNIRDHLLRFAMLIKVPDRPTMQPDNPRFQQLPSELLTVPDDKFTYLKRLSLIPLANVPYNEACLQSLW